MLWLRRDLRLADHGVRSDGVPDDPDLAGVALPEAGERAATARWKGYLADGASSYAETRERPAVDGTSGMSVS